jgi:hypothetical protein
MPTWAPAGLSNPRPSGRVGWFCKFEIWTCPAKRPRGTRGEWRDQVSEPKPNVCLQGLPISPNAMTHNDLHRPSLFRDPPVSKIMRKISQSKAPSIQLIQSRGPNSPGALFDEKAPRSYSLWSLEEEGGMMVRATADTITPVKRVFKKDEIPLSSAITSASGPRPFLCSVTAGYPRANTNNHKWDCSDSYLT